jgi:hypothetical protein
MDRYRRLFIHLVSRRLGLMYHKIAHDVCKHSRYSEVLLAGARGFFSYFWRDFFTLKSCISAVIYFFIFVIAYCFYNNIVTLFSTERTLPWSILRHTSIGNVANLSKTLLFLSSQMLLATSSTRALIPFLSLLGTALDSLSHHRAKSIDFRWRSESMQPEPQEDLVPDLPREWMQQQPLIFEWVDGNGLMG